MSPTFYEQLFANFISQKNNISCENRKVMKNTFKQNTGHKMLVKLIPGVDFINILLASLTYESKLSSFSLITFGFVIFGAKISYKKRAHS